MGDAGMNDACTEEIKINGNGNQARSRHSTTFITNAAKIMMMPLSSTFIVRIFVIAAIATGTGKSNGVDVVAGFNLPSPPSKSTMSPYQRTTMTQKSSASATTAIHVGASSSFNTIDHDDNNNEYNFQQLLLDNASACALSDTCSIEYAELYLREIFRAQVGCAAQDYLEDGYVADTTTTTAAALGRSSDEVCNIDNLHAIGEIVAKLKDKIHHHGSQLDGKHEDVVNTFWNQRQVELETLAATASSSSSSAPTAATWVGAPVKPAYLAIAALYTMAIMHAFQPPPAFESAIVVPFTFQEIWFAIRDGYFDTLVSHWFRNGGLLVGSVDVVEDAMLPLSSASLTPQEVFWSIRDGYADDTLFSPSTLSSSMPSSSLLSGMDGAVVPFSPQEVWWAIQGGYVNDLMGHWFRNGGLSV